MNHSAIWQPCTSLRRHQNDQSTLKFGQKHHLYAIIVARRHQNDPRRRQTLNSGEPRSPDQILVFIQVWLMHTLFFPRILAAWLASPGGLNIVFFYFKCCPESILFSLNCGIKIMFLMDIKVCGGPKRHSTLPRNSQADIAQRILLIYRGGNEKLS